ncbi:MAG: phosphoenolpyruvate--protein phosphotransferase [Candidatus Fermentibacteraceae bacterium]|nr:phosphoenolpyruvate--protein phosphotransferase [Candidatus Fermentibacteraceae bacterium]MBN2607639.1 phosphoenolpyruvate--protein phosphotransferase [Candidatus Fermentibacteraceae bacterium]
MSVRLSGTPASPGVSIGPAFLLDVEEIRVMKKELGSDGEVEQELRRFHKALEETRNELELISEQVSDIIEGKQLIEVHILLLNDPSMISDVEHRIRGERVSAEYAVSRVLYDVLERFDSMKDPYLRNRSVDVRDVGRRVMANLLGTEREALKNIRNPVILVSRDLDPSQTAGLSRRQLLGIVTDLGGSTSHTAILARSMGIPAVVGLGDVAEYAVPGQTVIIDGIHGNVILDPEEDQLEYYSELKKRYNLAEAEIALNSENPAVTGDGVPVELSANIEFSQEADQVGRFGGRGVGLFRTEFIRLLAPEMEDDEEFHFRAYSHVLKTIAPDPVIIRTLDLGGDKFLDSIPTLERNPFLGWRAIRICLDRPEKFGVQLRALLRAARFGNERIMLPMITDQFQILRVRSMLEEIAGQLDRAGIRRGEIPPLGIMVETPAAVIALDHLLPHADFVSIGTNDLTQYTLAVDRGSPYVSNLFDPFHPAVVRQIEMAAGRCRESEKWIGICGQMASDPLAIPLLIGFGINELSVPITLIPDVKEMLKAIRMNEVRELAAESLMMESGEQIRSFILKYVESRYPEIILDEIHRDREDGGS